MEIVGWVIWFLTCGCGVICLIAFLYEVFWSVSYGPQVWYPLFLRRLITGFAALGFIGAAFVTIFTEISKLHILWFIPSWHFFVLIGIPRWIYFSQKKGLSTKSWERFPTKFVKSVRQTLGADNFHSLTLLAQKYRLFDQNLFAHPEVFEDIHDEMTNAEIAALLTSMGNELAKRHIVEDAEEIFRIALALRPKHFAARAMLAVICYDTARLSEAKEHARRAITDMDSHTERYKDIPVPEHIADPNAIESFRLMLQSIAEGEISE